MGPPTTNWKYFNFKTGINPSPATRYNMEKLTPIQKVELSSARIFEEKIGGGTHRNGYRQMKYFTRRHDQLKERYSQVAIRQEIPDYREEDDRMQRLEKKERYLRRIIMKGIKIGVRKGGGKASTKDMYRVAMMRKFGIDEDE